MIAALGVALLLLASAPSRPRENDQTSLRQLAAAIAMDAVEAHAEPPVALHVRSESPELSSAFGTLVCAELSLKKLSCVGLDGLPFRDAESTARDRGARSLLRLNLVLEHGLVHARGDLLGTWVNFWSGTTPSRAASPAAALERSVDADAYVLTLLATPIPTSQLPTTTDLRMSPSTVARVPAWTAALTAADLDGDHKAELLALTEDELLVYSPDGKLLARRDLRALPLSVTPCREPYGFVSVLNNPLRIRYQTSRRARGETLGWDRSGLRALPGNEELALLQAGKTTLVVQPQPGMTVANALASFAGEGSVQLSGGPFTTVTPFALPTAGAYFLAVAPDGNAVISNGPGREARVSGLGAGSALVDVDGDGLPELITTSAEFAPAQEELIVHPLPQTSGPDALSHPRFHGLIPKGRALQVTGADLDGDGPQEIVVAVWMPDGSTELQVFRRAAP
ncbi:MAG: VCBS repeat-containing protein [Myxococcaceae bacterium]